MPAIIPIAQIDYTRVRRGGHHVGCAVLGLSKGHVRQDARYHAPRWRAPSEEVEGIIT